MTLEIWRDLTYNTSYREHDRLQDPVVYARMRFEQNIIAGLEGCGYQRQTGRTFRTLIRALQAIESRQTVLILVENVRQAYQMQDLLMRWAAETHSDRIHINETPQTSASLRNIMDRSERRIVATIAPIYLNVTRDLPADYDLVLLDNAIVDEILSNQMCGTSALGVLDTLTDIQQCRLKRKDSRIFVSQISDGSVWNVGDLFQLPKSETVGTLASINLMGCIPISLTVLYEGNLLELPWDTCDIFHRVSNSS